MRTRAVLIGLFTAALAPLAPAQLTLQELQLLAPAAPQADALFGAAVAMSGDTAVVGQPHVLWSSGGSAFMYGWDGASWSMQAESLPTYPWLGSGVALEGDTLLLSHAQSWWNRIQVRSGTSWQPPTTLSVYFAELGSAVAIEGDTIVFGAPYNSNLGTDAGAAFVFARSGTTWAQEAFLTASDGTPSSQFGSSVAVDGDVIVVGAEPRNRAYVFRRSGTTWTEEAKLQQKYRLGASVAVQGDRVLAGAPGDPNVSQGTGSAYVYVHDGSSWTLETRLEAEGGEFGASVDLDGPIAVVGAPLLNGARGRAYAYARTGSDWFHLATYDASDGAVGDELGAAVAVEGGMALVGAPRKDEGASVDAGGAYVFAVPPLTATPYCTAGVSASGCSAQLGAAGLASATRPSGFVVSAVDVEGDKDGLLYYGPGGRQSVPWGNGTSLQCVVPPVKRGGLLAASGTSGACDGSFSQDLNARWCPGCPKPNHNFGVGTFVRAQLWYRDPANTSNRTTSLSDALEFVMTP